jgi:hypothetical protein
MKTAWSSTFAAMAIAAAVSFGSVARGDTIFFSQVGPPSPPAVPFTPTVAPAPLSPTAIPNVTLESGLETTLHLWVQVEGAAHTYDSIAWSLESSNASVLTITGSTVANFGNGLGNNRWDSALVGELGDPGEAWMLDNSRGFKVSSPGVGNATPLANFDQGRDNNTGSFYLGTVSVRATGSGTAGLYLRNGTFRTVVAGAGATFRYGGTGNVINGFDIGAGDPIDAGLTMADAIITVPGVGREDVFVVGGDPTDGTEIPFEGVQPVAIDIGGPAGKIVVDPQFSRNSYYDVYFDITIAPDSNTSLGAILDLLEEQLGDGSVRPGGELPTGPNREMESYEFALHLPGPVLPGAPAGALGGAPLVGPLVLDFDFSANGMTGVTVNQVAVPEPSSIVLAALGLAAFCGVRRRKA